MCVCGVSPALLAATRMKPGRGPYRVGHTGLSRCTAAVRRAGQSKHPSVICSCDVGAPPAVQADEGKVPSFPDSLIYSYKECELLCIGPSQEPGA